MRNESAYRQAQTQLLCVRCGPVLIVLFGIGCIALGGFVPPPSAAASAEQIADEYRSNTESIRLGCLLMMACLGLIAPWGAAVAGQTRRLEGRVPVLTYTQVACIGAALVIVILFPLFWAVAAFRPDDVDPEITRTLNDIAWFLFLITWPPFSVWALTIAVAIFRSDTEDDVFPRWVAYFNAWCALLFVPAGLMSFFKTGAFSWSGVGTLYLPLTVFFIWMVVMSVVTTRAIPPGHAGAGR